MEDIPILAVVPVEIKDRLYGSDKIPYNVSPFHISHKCESCSVECWIGPKQLTMKNKNPEIMILCTNCLVEKGGPGVFDNISHLGGP